MRTVIIISLVIQPLFCLSQSKKVLKKELADFVFQFTDDEVVDALFYDQCNTENSILVFSENLKAYEKKSWISRRRIRVLRNFLTELNQLIRIKEIYLENAPTYLGDDFVFNPPAKSKTVNGASSQRNKLLQDIVSSTCLQNKGLRQILHYLKHYETIWKNDLKQKRHQRILLQKQKLEKAINETRLAFRRQYRLYLQ